MNKFGNLESEVLSASPNFDVESLAFGPLGDHETALNLVNVRSGSKRKSEPTDCDSLDSEAVQLPLPSDLDQGFGFSGGEGIDIGDWELAQSSDG